MPIEATRRRTQAERREEAESAILDATTRLIAGKGLDEFTLADAGEAAGYSRGLPAHYFGSKADLLTAVGEHIRRWFFTGLEAHLQTRRGLANLLAAIDFYFEVCGRDRAMVLALHTLLAGALNKPTLAGAVAKLNRESKRSVEVALRAGIANGEIRRAIDVDAWSIQILATVRGIIAMWLVDPDSIDLAAQRRTLVAALKRDLAP
ncbi:MAG: TetR family transcriptional regulator [Reyranella sp.]|uniref:TetR/AcrR family transcriptional regulator n=1 Tax=Reyranella sp. TaxID=1929291 RepID=UPI001ACE85F0|nr:TetR family transcriptional regulator [Reyranella sp.]MBN9086802.1 TetR family transcriptional regulator [Reyranella sp.]